jgi:lipopolysaccharide/colanic/teichoic acid biosynthesis glycosyltransferase
MEPRRMAHRYLVGNVTFMAREARNALRRTEPRQPGAAAKRLVDVTLAGGALLMLAPLFALVAIALRAESRGPVLFCQTRIGKDGREFTIFKFRSMYIDAEARRAALIARSDREGICFKARNDPRITRVGRVLRRYSIDELPQILNVLRGDMAIVGPRPALPQEVAVYPARALGRLAVKPGLTGVWQVSGRAEIGFDRMIDMDLAYARSRSVLLDLVLIALTFRAVISGRGAY